jgi:hypothetical protein
MDVAQPYERSAHARLVALRRLYRLRSDRRAKPPNPTRSEPWLSVPL